MKPRFETHSRGLRWWRLATAGTVMRLIPLTAVATAQPAAADAANRLAVEAMAAQPARPIDQAWVSCRLFPPAASLCTGLSDASANMRWRLLGRFSLEAPGDPDFATV